MTYKNLSFLSKLVLIILFLALSATTVRAYEVTVTNDTAYPIRSRLTRTIFSSLKMKAPIHGGRLLLDA